MKKILLLSCMLLTIGIQDISAQGVTMLGSNGKALDTLRNAATEYLTAPVMNTFGLSGKYDIQLVVTNDSATTAVTAILQGSNDGVNWDLWGKVPGVDGINCDSLTFTGTKVHTFHVQAGIAKYYLGLFLPTTFGRRIYGRIKLIHAAGGRSSYSGKLCTSE